MKAVIQRVTRASVHVEGKIVGQIESGLLVLLGVAKGDGEIDGRYLVEKIRTLRIFSDEQGENEPFGGGYRGIGFAGVPVYAPWTNGEWPSPELRRGGASG